MGRKGLAGLLGGATIGAATGGPVGAIIGGLAGGVLGKQIDNKDEAREKRLKTKHYECNDCSYQWTSKKSFGQPAHCPKCKSDDINLVD